ncbi:MAG: serine/threonine protein kinase [Myxococcaceae bacterium]|nr:serine/threonine protein kinase [Myxococcaceae bacterium]
MQFGKYELIERIAAGGMAEIFRARFSPAPGVVKPVVIKKILPHYAANRAFIAMFTNEARIVMGLSHGNIAQVFDFGDVDGDWYLAMELVDGQPLSKVVKRMRAMGLLTMPAELAAYVTAEMLKGLHYAHTRLDEQGRPLHIVHRDVSPQNVLVSYEGQIKLVDFGIARARNAGREDTTSNAVKGKYAYFAPEQARGKDLDARTDVFASGIVLYELLTGQLPFQGRMMEVLTKIVRGQFARPTELAPAIPKALEAIVLKAMALEASERYPSAEAFQQDLTRYLAVHHPDFTPTELSHFLSLLFESELVKLGRPVQLPREFSEKAQRWRRGAPVPEPEPESKPPPGEDPEEEVPTEMVDLESVRAELQPAPASPAGGDDAPTKPLRVPDSMQPPRPSRPERGPSSQAVRAAPVPWVRAIILALAAALVGFAAVFLAVRMSRSTLEVVSLPAGATVRVNGRAVEEKTPLQLRSLSKGLYRVEVFAEGYKVWSNDVPLKRGQHLVIDAVLERPPPPPPPKQPDPPPLPKKEEPPLPPPVPDAVSWPVSTFELDAARHRVDLSKAGALKLPLDEKLTYRVTLSRGPELGWGYYVVNAAGAAPGPLPTSPQQIKGANRLFVFRVPTSTLAGVTRPEETKPRTLTVESRGKPKTFKPPLALTVAPESRVTLSGLDPKAWYEVTVRQSVSTPARLRAGGAIVTRCVVGHPTQGLLVAELNKPLVVRDAAQLFFTLLDDTSDDQEGRLIIEAKQVKKGARR